MPTRLTGELEAFLAQSSVVADWLDDLSPADFARPSVLPGWDVRTLTGHLVSVRGGLARRLHQRSPQKPLAAAEYVRRYAPAAAEIDARAREVRGAPLELTAALRDATPVRAAADGVADRTVLDGARGPITALDWVTTRIVELVAHCDDLSRSLPERDPVPAHRPALASAVRTLARILAAQAPGRSVELRVPPFVAVQVVEGPRHTRGTPPNVVEAEPLVWVRLATGRVPFAEAVASGAVRASGNRADLSAHLPVLS